MTRADFQRLADIRVREAKVLLDGGEYDGAYYLAGYAVECALKACIIRMLNTSDDWQEQSFSNQCWSHRLELLMTLADLETEIGSAGRVTGNWATAKDWNEASRYEHGRSERDVRQFYDAISHPTEGVLQWLKARW